MSYFKTHHISLNVIDLITSITFYEKLGFEEKHRYKDGSVTIVHLLGNGLIVELFRYSNSPTEKTISCTLGHEDIIGIEHFSFHVDDIEKAYQNLSEYSTCTISKGRTGIDYFFISDPEGNRIEIVSDQRKLGSNERESNNER